MKYIIDMIPVAKGRPRVAFKNGKAHGYTPLKTIVAEAYISLKLNELGAQPIDKDKAIALKIGFVMPRPKSAKKRTDHIVKPDLDNMVKLVKDACKSIFRDQQVIYLSAWKIYESSYIKPRIELEIEEILR